MAPNTLKTPLQRTLLHNLSRLAMSQRALAKATGVDHSQISRLLSGVQATASVPTLQKIAGALQISIDELLGGEAPAHADAAAPADAGDGDGRAAIDPAALLLRLDEIADNPANPRQTIDEIEDDRLAESIASVGLLQPLSVVVEPSPGDGRPLYRITYGRRRLRALRRLAARGRWNPALANVPARRDAIDGSDPRRSLVAMLIENLQRLDLAPLDVARAYQQLRDLNLSTADIAERVHRSQRHVQQHLALVTTLTPELQQRLAAGAIVLEQARALAGAPRHYQAAIERAIAAGGEAPGPDAIERKIRGQMFPASRAAFALDGYTAAGGRILDDEETHERLCLDGQLFRRLQRRAAQARRYQLLVENARFVDLLQHPPADGAYEETTDETHAGAVVWLDRDLALHERVGVRRVQPTDAEETTTSLTGGGGNDAPPRDTPQADALRDEARAAIGAELADGLAVGRYGALRLLLLHLLTGAAPIDLGRLRALPPRHAAPLRAVIDRRRDNASGDEARAAATWHVVRELSIEDLIDGLAAGVADAFVLGDDAASQDLAGTARRRRRRAGAARPPVPGDHAAQQPLAADVGDGASGKLDIPDFLRR